MAAFALTVLVFGALLWRIGFTPQPSFTRSLLFSLFALTEIGEFLQVLLRLIGPLFFSLMLLALRGRVKR